jgi:hypothetical protein
VALFDPEKAATFPERALLDVFEIDVQNGHLEIIGTIPVLVIDVNQPKEFFAEIDFHGIVLLGPRAHVQAAIVEFLLQELLELDDLGVVHEPLLG